MTTSLVLIILFVAGSSRANLDYLERQTCQNFWPDLCNLLPALHPSMCKAWKTWKSTNTGPCQIGSICSVTLSDDGDNFSATTPVCGTSGQPGICPSGTQCTPLGSQPSYCQQHPDQFVCQSDAFTINCDFVALGSCTTITTVTTSETTTTSFI